MRVALLHHAFACPPRPGVETIVRDVAAGLRERGHEPVLISSHRAPSRRSQENGLTVLRVARLQEGPLRWRGFTGPLTQLPLTQRALKRGGFDLAHAFSALDAAVALRWGRVTGRPVVFTCAEPTDRSQLADRRLRLRLVTAAIEQSDAVLTPTEEARHALRRWMAADAPVTEPRDGAGHERLYLRLLPPSGSGRC